MVPVVGVAADAYNAYLYMTEGSVVLALLNAGVVLVDIAAGIWAAEDVIGNARFRFSPDARVLLDDLADPAVDQAVRQGILDVLDEAAEVGKIKYLDAPALKDGILNIGAGSKPIAGAYNIDLNPRAAGVYVGDATRLNNVATGSQIRIIMENPYGYDPLNSEILRVLQEGGSIEIIGSNANPFFNKIPSKAPNMGFHITETLIPNTGQFTDSHGVIMEKPETFIKYILEQN